MNLSLDSLTRARELGVFFEDPGAITQISAAFEQDWLVAVNPPGRSEKSTCPAEPEPKPMRMSTH
jgi:hypothetical protein